MPLIILQFFSIAGTLVVFLYKFIKKFLVKFITHGFVISAQFTILTTLLVALTAYIIALISAMIWLYNSTYDVLNSGFHNTSLSCIFGMLDCMGIISAFETSFSAVWFVVVMILSLHLARIVVSTLDLIGRLVFQIGLLLGQL